MSTYAGLNHSFEPACLIKRNILSESCLQQVNHFQSFISLFLIHVISDLHKLPSLIGMNINFTDKTFLRCGWETLGRLHVSNHDVLLVQETAGETSRVIVVKSSINIINHLRSDPSAWAPIHHEHTNRREDDCQMMKYLLPSCTVQADISVKIMATGWTLYHLSVEWSWNVPPLSLSSHISLSLLTQCAAATWGNESQWQWHSEAGVLS